MAGQGMGCNCCDEECTSLLCVVVSCGSVNRDGVEVTIYDDAENVVASGSTSGGSYCAEVPAPGTYTAAITDDSWLTDEDSVEFTDCDQEETITLTACRAEQTLTVRARGCSGCGIAGATVEIDGDWTDSETTDSNGDAVFTLTRTDCTTKVLTEINVIPPAGSGYKETLNPLGGGFGETISACTDPSTFAYAEQDSGYICICNTIENPGGPNPGTGVRYPVKTTLSYSDDYGSCTLTWNSAPFGGSFGPGWAGSYTYSSSNSWDQPCGGGNLRKVYPSTQTVPISVFVAFDCTPTPGCDDTPTMTLVRFHQVMPAYSDCAGNNEKCVPNRSGFDTGLSYQETGSAALSGPLTSPAFSVNIAFSGPNCIVASIDRGAPFESTGTATVTGTA